ncbi:very long chain fatty acid elongase 6-like [Centruroides vittatus]|uniref:very long chain fatty acid elongase 6-like n=1 Tax=Centruroides vittatus TaxID=120091 RepID=UPI00350FA2AA
MIYGGQKYMKSRKPYDLRIILFVWNFLLFSFSIIGTIRSSPELIYVIREFGFVHSICTNSYKNFQVSVCWNCLFLWSKVIELFDTVFIVLRKKNLIFQHWFHHALTLFFSWYLASELSSISRWYVAMNFFVHSLMYAYFAVKCASIWVPKLISMFITTVQIIQMIIGTFCTFISLFILYKFNDCDISESGILVAMFTYVVNLLLFIRFFYRSYLIKSTVNKEKAK